MNWKKEVAQIEEQALRNDLLQISRNEMKLITDKLDSLAAMAIQMRQTAERINRTLERLNED